MLDATMFFSEEDYYAALEDRCATESEACDEFARNAGSEQPEREWLLTSFDTWVRNPAYTGKPGRHPEDDWYDEEEFFADAPESDEARDARIDAAILEADKEFAEQLLGDIDFPF